MSVANEHGDNAAAGSSGAADSASAHAASSEPECEFARDALARAAAVARRLSENLAEKVRAEPGRALIVAAGVGLLVGVIAARRKGAARKSRGN